MGLLKGNALQKRLQDLGYKTDGTDWDNSGSSEDWDEDVPDSHHTEESEEE